MSDSIRSAGVAGSAAADGPLQCAAVQVVGQQLSVAATRRTLARIEDLFGGHLPAPIELLSQAAPHMQQQGSGTIVHVTARPGALSPARVLAQSKVTQKRLQPAHSRLSMEDRVCGAPVARITVIR